MKKMNWTRSLRMVVIGVGCIILILLVIDFSNRMAELRRLTNEKERVAEQVASLVETQANLQTQVAYATSEAAVYRWAYENKGMTRPGDILVIPIQAPGSTPIATPEVTPTPEVIHNWQVWLSLFVDQP